MNTLTIETADGETLAFTMDDDTDKTEADGILLGDTVTVTYTEGEDGALTATAVKITEKGENADADLEETATFSGEVVSYAEGALAVKDADGQEVTFTVPETATVAEGLELAAGAKVTVTYTGTLTGTDASAVTVTAVDPQA